MSGERRILSLQIPKIENEYSLSSETKMNGIIHRIFRTETKPIISLPLLFPPHSPYNNAYICKKPTEKITRTAP